MRERQLLTYSIIHPSASTSCPSELKLTRMTFDQFSQNFRIDLYGIS